MKIIYNTQKLARIIEDLSALTGICISFLDAERMPICSCTSKTDFCSAIQRAPATQAQCSRSDNCIFERCLASGHYESHICHAGLYDAAMPITKDGTLVGYVLMGRVRSSLSPKENLYTKNDELRTLFFALPALTDQQIESLRSLLPEILFEGAIRFESSPLADAIADHIRTDLESKHTVGTICKKFFISKNSLYKVIKEQYGCTVTDLVTNLRIDAAKALLSAGSAPVYTVAQQVGFENYPYFCKLFKKKTGISPGKYRQKA